MNIHTDNLDAEIEAAFEGLASDPMTIAAQIVNVRDTITATERQIAELRRKRAEDEEQLARLKARMVSAID